LLAGYVIGTASLYVYFISSNLERNKREQSEFISPFQNRTERRNSFTRLLATPLDN